MSETLRQAFPRIYDRLLPSFFDTTAPEEPKATCSACAMGSPAKPVPGATYFRPDLKCCTYEPSLPNYLVGALLADPDPALEEGRRRARAHIASRVGVTSHWLAPSRKRAAFFACARGSSFGRSPLLRCSYLSPEGLCTIWRHRESACSTFFCKCAAGADGQAFWRAVGAYLRLVERTLAHHAVTTLAPTLVEPLRPPLFVTNLTAAAVDQTLPEALEDRPPTPEDYASFWGAWEGREEELYRATFDLVSGMTRDDIERLVGAAPEELRTLEAAHQRLLSPSLPERLVLDLHRPPIPVEGGVVVNSYSKYEPVQLSPALFDVLRELRADETVTDFRARMLRDHEVEVPEDLLIELHRMRAVIEP